MSCSCRKKLGVGRIRWRKRRVHRDKIEVECIDCEETWWSKAASTRSLIPGSLPSAEELAYDEGYEDGADGTDYGGGVNINPFRKTRLGK